MNDARCCQCGGLWRLPPDGTVVEHPGRHPALLCPGSRATPATRAAGAPERGVSLESGRRGGEGPDPAVRGRRLPPRPAAEFKILTREKRKAIFRELVLAQDNGLAVAHSRQEVAGRYGLSEQQVLAVEQEGVEAQWPPLD